MRIGILGYGRLGSAVEKAAKTESDITVSGIFSDRNIKKFGTYYYHSSELFGAIKSIDVLMICKNPPTGTLGAAPVYAEYFNTVDVFNDRSLLSEYYCEMNKSSISGGNVSIISAGIDPGFFSVLRAYGKVIKADADNFAFSEEHSDSDITAKIMLSYARAAYRQQIVGTSGAYTVFDFRLKDIYGFELRELLEFYL